jgi:hypothetical protein
MNWLKILQIIETLAAVLAQLLAPKPGVAAPAAQTDEAASVTNSLTILSTLYQAHATEPPATQAKVTGNTETAHEYLKPLTGL